MATLKSKETNPVILRILLPKEFKRKWYLLVLVLDRRMYENNKGNLQIEVGYFQTVL